MNNKLLDTLHGMVYIYIESYTIEHIKSYDWTSRPKLFSNRMQRQRNMFDFFFSENKLKYTRASLFLIED